MWLDIAESAPEVSPWHVVLGAFRQIDPTIVAAYAALFLGMQAAKVWRWGVQLRALGVRSPSMIWHAGIVGFAAIAWLPLRLGELARPALAARASKVPFSALLATSVIERVVDGLIVCGLILLAWPFAPHTQHPLLLGTTLFSCAIFFGVSGGIGLFMWRPQWALGLVEKTIGRALPRMANRIEALLHEFRHGVRSLRGSRSIGRYVGWTAIYWLLNGATMALWLHMFGLDVGLWAGLVVVSVLMIGIMLPSGPGFLGNFQLFLSAGVGMWLPIDGSAAAAASAFVAALTLNLIQLFLQSLAVIPSLRWLIRFL